MPTFARYCYSLTRTRSNLWLKIIYVDTMDAAALSKATQYTAANSARKQTVMTQPTNHATAAAIPANLNLAVGEADNSPGWNPGLAFPKMIPAYFSGQQIALFEIGFFERGKSIYAGM